MDPVSVGGRQGRNVAAADRNISSTSRDEWNGYQWTIPLDEVCHCDSCPQCCRTCYYKGKGMNKKYKSICAAVIIAASVIITALIVRFSLGSVDVMLGAGDQRPIINEDNNFSPLMCSYYNLNNVATATNPVAAYAQPSETPQFDAYLLMDKPYLSYRDITYTKVETMFLPDESSFNYWAFYMESGSSVTITMCNDNEDIYLQILQGKSEFDHWVSHRDRSHGVSGHTFPPCSGSQSPDSYTYAGYHNADEYVYTFTTLYSDAGMNNIIAPVTFFVSRKELIFDEWAVHASCDGVADCSLPVPNKAEAVMLEMKQNASVWPITIRTDCIPSIVMYFAFFLGLPVGITLVLVTCGGILYLCQMSVIRDVENADRARSTATMNNSSRGHSDNTGSSSASSRRIFRITSSQQTPLVDHDVLSAMANQTVHQDLPPMYDDVAAVSSAVEEGDRREDHVEPEPPPSYDSIVM